MPLEHANDLLAALAADGWRPGRLGPLVGKRGPVNKTRQAAKQKRAVARLAELRAPVVKRVAA